MEGGRKVMGKIKFQKMYLAAALISTIFLLCSCESRSVETGKTCDFIEVEKFETGFITKSCIVLQSEDDVSSLRKKMKEEYCSEEVFAADFEEEALLFLTICRGIDEKSTIESVKLVKDEQGRMKGQIQVKLTALQEVMEGAACYENAILRLPKEDAEAAESFEIVYVLEPWEKSHPAS